MVRKKNQIKRLEKSEKKENVKETDSQEPEKENPAGNSGKG